MSHSLFKYCFHALILTLTIGATFAQTKDASTQNSIAEKNSVSVENAWVRPTNAGQEVGAAYMTFISKKNVNLVHVESDVTKSVEIHSMVMQNGVMKMRMLEKLPLTAGKPYQLAPGGFHLMLFDLKKPLTEGEQVNFTLTFKLQNNIEFKQQVKAVVKVADGETGNNHGTHEHHHH
ncbi:MAG: copper chaperone PCu(A)C [Methylotenera sp.]|nr:copper chaperone PCu(A)C [Methylotenera sp.]MDO9232003.1 copper chaperone PCu(A)C [Methylotenera sp.]MDO9389290.1 copper chaperone PCu(A)C [Methylotenera sp.]MDP1596636.1 copper chaperone PCu(A)C [Methylotenera sp.]MDP1755429.1 copper chaperone PCu(A)C [Methylotenera sp.]